MKQLIWIVIAGFLLAPGVNHAFGPFDYTNPEHVQNHLRIVEQYHFRHKEKTLQDVHTIWKDLDYTLRTFPNHHHALNLMAKLLRMKDPGKRTYGRPLEKDIDYYFKSAIRFAPRDGTVRLLYGLHFHKTGDYKKALAEYLLAKKSLKDSAELHYNLGLLYIELKKYDKALTHAKRAYELGHILPGLRNKLHKLGVWKN